MMPEREPLAQLNDEQMKALNAMEKELGVTLVAYEGLFDDSKDQIVESDV
ncbi:hypothetical protein [Sporosarcina highlanderae]|uniref:Uncharacterized protein n=1 Tax=Sporosarcina highlanderae TaxID=3035916 RepID=A0ABT8JNF7_9BACL|nr:hypothetical protein [Sporosarcina highlanderae]MDN4606619.1 hypothetical protein [Sporosarcina highlanderae]